MRALGEGHAGLRFAVVDEAAHGGGQCDGGRRDGKAPGLRVADSISGGTRIIVFVAAEGEGDLIGSRVGRGRRRAVIEHGDCAGIRRVAVAAGLLRGDGGKLLFSVVGALGGQRAGKEQCGCVALGDGQRDVARDGLRLRVIALDAAPVVEQLFVVAERVARPGGRGPGREAGIRSVYPAPACGRGDVNVTQFGAVGIGARGQCRRRQADRRWIALPF